MKTSTNNIIRLWVDEAVALAGRDNHIAMFNADGERGRAYLTLRRESEFHLYAKPEGRNPFFVGEILGAIYPEETKDGTYEIVLYGDRQW